MKLKHKIIFLIFAFAIFSCHKSFLEIRRIRLLMGTEVEIIVQGTDKKKLEQAVEAGFKEIERLEKKLSRFRDDSFISLINKNAGRKPVKVDKEVFELIKTAKEICQQSKGAFDITILPVLALWKFGEKNPTPPPAELIKEKLKLVGCDKLKLDSRNLTVYLSQQGMGIDLGGVAKGYAGDCTVRVLKSYGVKSGIVNVGGDLCVFGAPSKGFAIGLRSPFQKNKIIAKIYLKEQAIATSGDYEKYFIYQGKRYSHILDPRTGYPALGERSVSVVCAKGILADAWATALFVLGSEQGIRIVNSQPELEAIFIDALGTHKISQGLKNKIIWLEDKE